MPADLPSLIVAAESATAEPMTLLEALAVKAAYQYRITLTADERRAYEAAFRVIVAAADNVAERLSTRALQAAAGATEAASETE